MFVSPYTGTITLDGEFNHAIFNNKYYKLLKIKVLDLTLNRYEYQLEEDIMMNLLSNGAEIRGILNRTNIPEILEENLNYTVPILETPAKLVVNEFMEVKATWKETAQFIPYTEDSLGSAIEPFISRKD